MNPYTTQAVEICRQTTEISSTDMLISLIIFVCLVVGSCLILSILIKRPF